MKDKKTLNSKLNSLNYYVIFDCDGVIVDDRRTYYVAIHKTVNFFMKKLHFPLFRKSEIIEFKFKNGINNDWDLVMFGILKRIGKYKKGISHINGMKILKETTGIDYDEIVNTFDSIYYSIKKRERLFLKESFFRYLKKKNFKLGIVSGRIKKDLIDTLERFSIKKYFSFIYTEDDIPNIKYRKPHPYLLDRAIKENVKDKERVIFVGDSIADKVMYEKSKYKKRIKFIPVDFSKRGIFKLSLIHI